MRGEWESFVRGRGSDLYCIREYMPEDSARHVDWKATAKSGSLKVREFSREDERKLCIVFDNPAAGAISEAAYEHAVNLAATLGLAFFFAGRRGFIPGGRAGMRARSPRISGAVSRHRATHRLARRAIASL